MSEITIFVNGKECKGQAGDTILKIASTNGVYIPTLCHDETVAHYGACGICLVEGEGLPKLMRACSTVAADGWKLSTETDRVKKARKIALELLMSDHDGDCKGPCSLTCPAGTDCMAYVNAVSRGEYHEAVKIVKEKFPLPASLGHICPHPCEKVCRRQYVEDSVSIAYIKRFAGLRDLEKDTYVPAVQPDTGYKVAIIGGGPGGLTAAFHLRKCGHAVTIFDAMDHMGGMLRYGIPQYRLPKEIVEKEVQLIADLGVEMRNNVYIKNTADACVGPQVTETVTLEDLRKEYNAVIVAVGAWQSSKVGCPGEDAEGVIGGIDFLRHNILGTPDNIGKSVAIVGGGNTAMDACRSAVRLGAENVYVIYRRTRAEMPADDEEITQAIEEGVTFKFLTNPAEIISENGHVTAVKLQVMELGEPDASGRRSPVPVEGKFETLEVNTVIAAIGQKVIPLPGLELNKKGIIAADEFSYRTNLNNVFAIGDATNKGASIAIEAIGEGQKCGEVVDSFLTINDGDREGVDLIPYHKPFYSERNLDNVKKELAERPKLPRLQYKLRPAEERKKDFDDIVISASDEEIQTEAKRCLECGCWDYKDCRLIQCANCDAICPERLKGEYHPGFEETLLVSIERNQKKCISCNLCVRVCDEVAGKGILGLVGRGFTTIIKPEFNKPETIACCKDCHKCADACPTGALKILK